MTKKANARLALLAAALLAVHVIFEVCVYSMRIYAPLPTKVLGWSFAALTGLHIILVIFGAWPSREHGVRRKYYRLNMETVLQRVSALIIILLLPLHIKMGDLIFGNIGGPDTLLYALLTLQAVFQAAVLTHIAVSVPRGFLTLGWVIRPVSYRRLQILCRAVCAVLFLLSVAVIFPTQIYLYHAS